MPIDDYADEWHLDARERLMLFLQVAEAVADAHATGRLALADFGIAYAAPEQARGEAVTTATDIYVLGVLLYMLLTGRHPTAPDSRKTSDILRRLVDDEPPRASVAVTITTSDADDAVRRAKVRRSSPERLRRLYRGALDSILITALEKQPTARYATVTAFADDVRRYLHNEPISVRTDAWSYRVRKFLRRRVANRPG